MCANLAVASMVDPAGCTICTMGAAEPSSVVDRDVDLRQVIDSCPVLIHTTRADGYLDFFNQTWLGSR